MILLEIDTQSISRIGARQKRNVGALKT